VSDPLALFAKGLEAIGVKLLVGRRLLAGRRSPIDIPGAVYDGSPCGTASDRELVALIVRVPHNFILLVHGADHGGDSCFGCLRVSAFEKCGRNIGSLLGLHRMLGQELQDGPPNRYVRVSLLRFLSNF
jgi:hypothetical protein